MNTWRGLSVMAALLLVIAACGGGDTSPTTAGETSPTTAGETSPTTAGETSPTTEATTTTEAVTRSLTLAIEGTPGVTYLPTMIAIDRFRDQGYEVELVQFESSETMTQALANGQIDVGSTSAGVVLAAVDAGLNVRAFLGLSNNNFVMVARSEYAVCESLDGRRVGIHSFEGTTGTMTQVWFEEQCPEAQPELQVLPGSENRLAALLVNQLDASALGIPSAIQLQVERPGEFVVIDSFAELDIIASYFYATVDWLTSNADLARAFTSTYIQVVEDIYADPTPALEKAAELIPEIDAATMERIVQQWVDQRIWNPLTGLEEDRVAFTIDFYKRNNDYPNVTGPADLVDPLYAG